MQRSVSNTRSNGENEAKSRQLQVNENNANLEKFIPTAIFGQQSRAIKSIKDTEQQKQLKDIMQHLEFYRTDTNRL